MTNEHHHYIESDDSEYGESAPRSSHCSAASDNRFIHLHPCAVSGDMPDEIVKLIERCEVRDVSDNDDLSLSLKFGVVVWRRLLRMAEHYERQADTFADGDIRGPMMSQAAKDMRFVLSDTARDL